MFTEISCVCGTFESVVCLVWNGFNVIHESESCLASLDLGFQPSMARSTRPAKFVNVLIADNYADSKVASTFMVYQEHCGDKGASWVDVVVLSGATHTEKSRLFVNFEGWVQQTPMAVPLVGDAHD
ncbi:hypothetical protein CEUSTIGMA_g9912.t1 [Chlamydomonas eustigma]|uniref:Molybdopterin oxidoreductase domain-containing protein n=1 Tax=Chlamydomonas eustigma TaxID=1157962 RepID=A0A250XHC9_9CHLO|nr:hypothetical protein CEUSTIGMA_g9912.t1 [Chlamydomonas eustigma]|eukprot:GAX82485.1 hypothetical protein CEUSTIGMA_g9912.t1 [Chlamydomonas eustigma]